MKFEPRLSNLPAGISRYWTEDANGELAIATTQSDEVLNAIIDRNKAMAVTNDGYSPSREFRRVASIPYAILQLWREQDGIDYLHPDNKEALRKKLNDSDWAALRTAPGRI